MDHSVFADGEGFAGDTMFKVYLLIDDSKGERAW